MRLRDLLQRLDGRSYKAFKEAWEERRSGLMPITGELKAVETSAAKVRAELPYSDYDTLKMRLTNKGWRITSGVLDLYSQDTPRKALVAFVRAMDDADLVAEAEADLAELRRREAE